MIVARHSFPARAFTSCLANNDARVNQKRESAMMQTVSEAILATIKVEGNGVASHDTNGHVDGSKTNGGRKTPFSDEQLLHFHGLLLEKRAAATEDIDRMKASLADAREHSGSDTAYSVHMADAGTDAMEREKLYLMMARQQKYVGYIDRAIERIGLKTYGVCKVTQSPISFERLEAVPHTELSVEAKLQQKPSSAPPPKYAPKRR